MNSINIAGNLTKKPEIKYTPNGNKVANFSIAVARDKETTDFFNCFAFGKSADILEKYTDKGSQVGLTGKLQTSNYDGADGRKVYKTEINVLEVTLLGRKSDRVSEEKSEEYEYPQNPMNASGEGLPIKTDDLPF